MIYKLYCAPPSETTNAVLKINNDGSMVSFLFDPANTDYQTFKTALQTGKNFDGTDVVLNDADGSAMTADQIATFLATLP